MCNSDGVLNGYNSASILNIDGYVYCEMIEILKCMYHYNICKRSVKIILDNKRTALVDLPLQTLWTLLFHGAMAQNNYTQVHLECLGKIFMAVVADPKQTRNALIRAWNFINLTHQPVHRKKTAREISRNLNNFFRIVFKKVAFWWAVDGFWPIEHLLR
jgi:hypothetical protein